MYVPLESTASLPGIMGVSADGGASTYYDSWLDMRCGKYMHEMQERAGKRIIENLRRTGFLYAWA